MHVCIPSIAPATCEHFLSPLFGHGASGTFVLQALPSRILFPEGLARSLSPCCVQQEGRCLSARYDGRDATILHRAARHEISVNKNYYVLVD